MTTKAIINKTEFEYIGVVQMGLRMQPEERYQQIISTYAALATGNEPAYKGIKHYLAIGHTQIADILGISNGVVFSYLQTVDALRAGLRDWAIWAFSDGNPETKAIARQLLMQIASVEPDILNELGLRLTLTKARVA